MGQFQSYLIRRGNEYLVTIAENPTGSGRYQRCFSIYKYDGARIPQLWQAKHVARTIRKQGEEWKIDQFDELNGNTKEVWGTAE